MDTNRPQEPGSSIPSNDSESKAHLLAIINNSPGFIYSIDRNFRLISFNEICKTTALQLFGLQLKIGDRPLDYFETIHPLLSQEWKNIYARAFTGEKINFVQQFNTPSKTYWDISLNPIVQQDEITGIACFGRDITQQTLNVAKLTESEARFRAVSENPLIGIAWVNAEGRLTHANQAFCDLMEGSLEELIGMHPADITHPDDIIPALPYFKQIMSGKINHYRIEKRYITLKKNIKWVELNINSLNNEHGEIEKIIAVVQDISEKKKAQEALLKSEDHMRYILDNSGIATALLDKNFNILKVNRLANEWGLSEVGITLNEGDDFLKNFPETYKSVAITVMKKVIDGTPHQYEAKYTTKDKSVRWFHVKLAPIAEANGNIIGLCITAADTTQRRNAEAEIQSLNDSLEQKVTERTKELEDANKELEAFTYSVSHDLLSPLRNIDSFIDILIEDYKNILSEDGRQTLGVIKRNSTLMGRLINDLLNFARIGKLPVAKQLVNMESVVNEVKDELRFMANKLAGKINVKEMNPAFCDPQLIKQVWVNLISNAVKYSGNKENPEIEIGSLEQGREIIYYVKDNGVGFDVRLADKLFGVFHRLHKSSEFEGTGVGLAIVHRIITKHGGRIWADAKVNEGAIFYFTLEN